MISETSFKPGNIFRHKETNMRVQSAGGVSNPIPAGCLSRGELPNSGLKEIIND